MTLAYPWVLVLALLPLALFWRRREARPVQAPVLPLGHWLAGMPGVSTHSAKNPLWLRLLTLLGWLLLVLALARPQVVGDARQLPTTGRDLMLVVDISPSMDEPDMVRQGRRINRLQAVKQVLAEFIDQRRGDRLGLILFGSQAYVQAPLTFDRTTVNILLQEAGLGMAGNATAIGDAVGLAVKRLRERPLEQRVAIVLTDGANTAGEITPDKASELAQASAVRLYTIGIGAGADSAITGLLQRNPSRDLDEALLTRMAQQTGGQYFRARNLAELSGIYASINQLEPAVQEGQFYRPVREHYVWPAALAIMLWLFALLFRRYQKRRQQPLRHGSETEKQPYV
ncbi:Ca-activated chloride channel family protein [Marinobacter sp. LV10R520-4]|uniref:vWA domain-containing protein n=1 Tax=Marinobacter sp. LV10R520-4 TaxID=1761796 RepID=UPI000BF85C8E|nr:VWA domain-containing protein [Marinobacter sp. LV10R520-4]PFG53639.1 Ca-activated chloride channel family protein [Marinobacter sp. LV10R520-4]